MEQLPFDPAGCGVLDILSEEEYICVSLDLSPQDCPSAPPQRFCGCIYDRRTLAALEGVRVTLRYGSCCLDTVTGCDGSFCFSLPGELETITLELTRPGYVTRYIGTVPLSGHSITLRLTPETC